MRVTLKAVNDQLRELGSDAELKKGDGYFYFSSGEAAGWLNPTVRVPTLGSLTMEQWLEEFQKLKALNRQFSGGGAKPERPQKSAAGRSRRAVRGKR